MKTVERAEANNDTAARAASIMVAGGIEAEWPSTNIFTQPLLFKATGLLALSGAIAGVLSILHARKIIPIEGKDLLIGGYYLLALGGAIYLNGGMTAKRAAAMIANVILFQTWNAFFFSRPPLGTFIFVLQMWLPLYWMKTNPSMMENIGIRINGMLSQFLVGATTSVVMLAYFSWSLINFSFSFTIVPMKLIVNTCQVFPMYMCIFSMLYMVWSSLRSMGLSPTGILAALAILSASLNAPVFSMVGVAAGIPLSTSAAGFATITALMVLSTNLTFGRYRSILPATIFFTALAALLLITGLT